MDGALFNYNTAHFSISIYTNRTRSRPKTSTTMKNMTSASALWGKGCGG